MAVKTKIDPINRDIEVMLNSALSPAARSKAFANYASEQIDSAKQTNKQILGRIPHTTITVDGREGAALETVRPDGVIVAEFDLFNDVLKWIADQLELHSPVKSGEYKRSHTLFADGTETRVGETIPGDVREFVFLNTVPYARKIERGASSQAPDGVYQGVAVLARRRFGNIAKIWFSYRTPISGSLVGGRTGNRSDSRTPAIIVSLGGR